MRPPVIPCVLRPPVSLVYHFGDLTWHCPDSITKKSICFFQNGTLLAGKFLDKELRCGESPGGEFLDKEVIGNFELSNPAIGSA